MSEQNDVTSTATGPKTSTKTSAPAVAATAPEHKPEAVSNDVALRSRIVQQGKPHMHVSGPGEAKRAKAGKYEVVHGSLVVGYDGSGEAVRAYPGAIVDLSAEEAGQALAGGSVKAIAA